MTLLLLTGVFDFLFVFLNFGLGVLLASAFIAHKVYLPMINQGMETITELSISDELITESSGESDTEEEYENKYKNEFEELENVDLSEEKLTGLKNNILIETTPLGNILMFYDHTYDYFKYYCSTKEIPYKILETVARRYVITNNCKSLFIDFNKEVEKAIEKTRKKSEEEQEKTTTPPPGGLNESVFAQLKSYNAKDKKKNESETFIKEKINKYKYGGKMEEYTIHKKPEKDKVLKLDFASFKRMMGEENENKKSV